ncbi:MAG: hypothetical protein CBB95_17840 [Alteromonas sp. TMED35]|uniref:hypothetical protein n=1 Tax=uncultured Alteromonas sp. TaxID=179113 RepID=UPI000B67673A|nr:MAG: hypothetical protein CBB95_17840 [Alteromonas sp. TMED35]|tara:strand:+ start:59706 stop:60059 length:354 start_codon:yes stop_codon:yes gene_type:complete
MSKNKELFRIPTNDALTTIDVELSYQLGGHNPWSYANEKRGIYVSVSPIKREGGFKSFTAFSGVKSCIKELKRFSNKAMENAKPDIDTVKAMVMQVCQKSQLTIDTASFKDLESALS